MSTKPGWRQTCMVVCSLLLLAGSLRAEDTYETLIVGTNIFKNVRVIQSNPVNLLIGFDGGYQRIKLQDLPDELKAKYPYDAGKSASYEKQKAQEESQRRAQIAAAGNASLTSETRAWLVKKQTDLQTRIKSVQTELKRLDAAIQTQSHLAKGTKRKSQARKDLENLRQQKMDVRDQMWILQDELEKTKTDLQKYQ